MEPKSRADLGDKLKRTGMDALKSEVITGMPCEEFADIQNIYENFQERKKLTGSKPNSTRRQTRDRQEEE